VKKIVEGFEEILLNPGELYFGRGNTRISTLLGSCVSITLWHPRQRIGGMCHYVIEKRVRAVNGPLDGRFGNEAFELLLQQVKAAGTRPAEYQVKLFGGGKMFSSQMEVGPRNIEFGRQLLANLHITPMAEHVGGSGRRKLHFDLWDGNAWLAFPQGKDAHIRGDYD